MLTTYDNLTLVTLDHFGHSRTCDYWYLVRQRAEPHTAFRTRGALLRWLDERGISLTAELPPHESHSWQELRGVYRRDLMLDHRDSAAWARDWATPGPTPKSETPHTLAAWGKLQPILITRELSNGDHTEARITLDPDGIRTVYVLNPNVRERKIFDHAESRAILDYPAV